MLNISLIAACGPVGRGVRRTNRACQRTGGFYALLFICLDDFIPRAEALNANQIRTAFRSRQPHDQMVTVTLGGGR
ncbi:MAG: hypothetical protein ACYDBA_02350 [Sulfuricaulis sp.]